jgi:23S rRNA (uracil1939-C5)-methyltransferase
MAERLYELAIEYARPSPFERVFDLYCGVGTISLTIAPRVAEVWGLELVSEAIRDAISNARFNEVGNVHFLGGDVRRRVTYVSCNPTTLAPNAAQLVEAGFRLERVRPVDMFPQTPHIECVASLARDGG